MIDLDSETIQIPGREPVKIKSTTVWWLGPMGLVLNMRAVKEQATLLRIETHQIPFSFSPVPVALGEDGSYELMR